MGGKWRHLSCRMNDVQAHLPVDGQEGFLAEYFLPYRR